MENIAWKILVIAAFIFVVLQGAGGDPLPPLVNAPNYISVKEDVHPDSIIVNITAQDPGGGEVTITTGSSSIVYLRHNPPDLWLIYLNTTLDRETTNRMTLSFTAQGQIRLPFSMELYVLDVNDVAPMFQNLPYNVYVKENTTSGTVMHTGINTTDPDDGLGGMVQFSMKAEMQGGESGLGEIFTINAQNGDITLTGHLDYETNKFYHYNITAKDGGNLTSTTDLFITVTDVQDTEPYFTGLPYMISIPENTPIGSVYKVKALDGDTGVPNNVTYSFVSADPVNCSSFFGIDSATGNITVTSNPLDRDRSPFQDKNGVCVFIVQATEISTDPGPRLNDTANCTLTITVNDVNDNVPTFSNNSFTATITENSGPGTPLTLESGIQISVSDADQGVNSDFSLSLSTTCLSITPTSVRGSANIILLVSNRSCFDFEVLETMTFKIIATESTTGNSSSVDINLMILNENDNDPAFNQTSYNGSVVENVKDLFILQVHATDNDAGIFGNISYSLEGDRDRFTINNKTGEITTKDANVDRETKDIYLLTVVATDPGGRRSGVPLAITVTDANDETPTFMYSYASRIAEGSLHFAPNLTLKANDNDQQGSENSRVIYRIANCKPNVCSNFALDGNSGLLAVNSPLDYENLVGVEGVITITVWAIDNGSPQLTGNTTVQITVEDKNDVQPVFSSQTYRANVPENAPSGSSVGQVEASDSDGSAPNNDVFYIISSGSNDQFVIDGNSGNITTVGTLDRERIASYVLIVLAIDRGSPAMTASTTVSIGVLNVNDDLPKFEPPVASVSVDEEKNPGFLVYNFIAHDGDSDAALNYSILWKNSSGLDESQNIVSESLLQSSFKIDSSTGFISVNERLDRETLESAVLLIMVVDTNAAANTFQTATGTVSVRVNDVNDHVPVFSLNGTVTANVAENSPTGTPLQMNKDITILDRDKDANSDFNLTISDHADCLEVTPVKARREATVLIRVSDPKCFDYEIRQTLEFQIIATESTTRTSSNITITLMILNENDNDPTFTQTSYNGSVVENVKDHFILQVHATDNDAGIFGNISYSLEGDRDRFTINNKTGEITTKDANVDRETKDTYLLTVVATDSGGRRSGVPLAITVTDANDETPVFLYSYASRIAEGSLHFAPNLSLQANDNDQQGSENSRVIYRIANCKPNVCSNFALDGNSGLLAVNSPLDYENLVGVEGVITITVWAIDNGSPQLTGNTTVQITVEDKNDVQPVFSSQTYRANVPENAPSGSSVGQVEASDSDGSAPNNDVFYIISSGSNDQFVIDGNSGNITTVGTLDRERIASYVLIVLAIDRGSPAMTASTTVSIGVLNVNDDLPKFEPPVASVSVDEEKNPGFLVYNFIAHDGDSDAALNYSILWKNSSGLDESQNIVSESLLQSSFKIDSSTGFISVNERLDRETLESAVLLIMVVDTNAAANTFQTATGTVSVRVNDVNDHVPVFSLNGTVTANVAENSPTGTPLQLNKDITILDRDKDANSDFNLTISDHADCLEVTPVKARREATVLIRVSDPKCFDYEIRQTLEFQIIATESTTRTSSNITITLMILNENDNDPTFTQTSYNGSVVENVKDHFILQVHATDNDAGIFGNISYSLEGDRDRFTINNKTGEITTKDANVDRETKDTYLLTVVATDSGGRRSGVPLAITVTDANDETPVFLYSYASRIAEGSLHFAPNLSLQANDNDQQGSENSRVIYRIANCKPNVCSNFALDGNSGLLAVNSPLDYENLVGVEGVITITVWAIDNGSPQLTGNTTVQITVEDKNDVQPVFSSQTYRANVPENAPSGSSVGQVEASDSDGSAPNNDVFYIISSGSNDQFVIDGNSGNITTVGTLDRERIASYVLIVLAIDRGSPAMTASTTVSIGVLNVNDDLPKFEPPVASVSVDEEKNPGFLVYNFIAHDGDSDAALNYSILWKNSSGLDESQNIVSESLLQSSFKIDSSTGFISVNERLDRETLESAVLLIMVVDTNAAANTFQTATGTVSVRVNDVNDHVPVFSLNGTVTANVAENSPTGTPLQMNKDITILDRDKDANSDFNLTISDHADCLEVTPVKARREATVLIRVSDPKCFDYEIRQTLEFQIIATESTTRTSSNITITLMILNENDNDPTFTQTSYNGSVVENVKDHFILQVHATDNDAGIFGNISYSLEGDRDRFTINNKTGEITTKDANVDRETKDTYLLTVVATDSGGRRSGVPLAITVTDANDETPVFLYSYASRIAEGSLHFAPNLSLQANDNDQQGSENSRVIYRIANCKPNVCSNFALDGNSGLLAVNSPLDYENLVGVEGVITITVWAIDNGSPQLTGNTTVQITVEDKNDVQPVFSSQTYRANVPENAPSGSSVGQVEASDSDGSAPNNDVFYIISSGSNDQFVIDGNSGNITTVGTLDRERIASYVLIVLAIDRGSPAMTASTTVSIGVLNVNDDLPKFEPPVASVSVDEEKNPGFLVYNFIAHDGDSDAALNYSILWKNSSGLDESQNIVSESLLQSSFKIDSSTGFISVNERLDRETLESAVLLIMVVDTNAAANTFQTATGTVSVRVNDVNDHVPVFSLNGTVTANVAENSPTGTPLQMNKDITILDRDKDANSDFNLTISDHADCLEVTPVKARREATVLIRVSDPKCFDYEIRQTLEFQIIATESTTRTSSNITITLMILNENDNDPTFTQTSYNGSVVENVKDHFILQVHATDNDAGIFGNISYSLEGDRDRFTINNKTGEITTKDANVDRETKDTYLLTVVATDSGGRRSGVPLAITVTDANDETPVFLYSYASRIAEGSLHFAPNLSLQANDNDQQGSENSRVIYRIANCKPNVCSNFALDGNSGLLAVNSPLDYENLVGVEGVITITVWAIDNGSPQLTGNTTVQITVEDKNDVQPVFSSQTYRANVPENAPSGSSVGQVEASDSDGSAPNNDVFYIISSGSNDQFVIDGNSGNITTVGTLDRERIASYVLIVLAIDRGSPAMTASTTVSIGVLNVNDDLPKFEPPVASVSVDEEKNPGFLVYNFIAHDGDSDAALNYSILWKNSSGLDESQNIVSESLLQSSFKIDSSTGFISVNERLDRETLESAVLLIMVVDTNAAANTFQTATGTVSVRVNDVNDHVPVFSLNGTVTANVAENSPTGTPLQMNKDITILDRDKDANSDFNLTISDHADCLEVTPVKARREATVLIRVSDPKCFDYEIRQTLEFQIIATESTTRTSSNITITLMILNENDNDPTFTQTSYNGSVVENVKDHFILQVHATDNDAGIFGNISYSLEGDRDRFTINNKTGEITTKDANVDRETKDTYLLTVVATDSGGRRSGVPLAITVTDANDETPVFLYSYASRIAEGSLHFAPNLSLQANDNDQQGSENSRVIYRIANCKPNVCSNFALDGNSGLLAVNSPLDYENLVGVEGVITITVWAIDNGSPQLTGNTTVQITVEDKNDVQPVFSSQTYRANVPENAPSGSSVGQVEASDSDGSAPNNDVFYIISSGSNDQFVIDGNSGNITTVGTLDRERIASYVLIVLAIDRGSPAMTASTTVSIGVLNVNDDLPKFEPPVASVSVDEEKNPGFLVYNFIAHDGDSDAALNYSILWKNSSGLDESQNIVSESLLQSSFKIDSSTGFISVNERLDRETLESAVLLIMVVDTNAAANTFQTATGTVSVRVNDVNDHVPVFSLNGTVTANVAENSPTGTPLQMNKDITILDRDKDANSDFNLTISDHADCLEVTPVKARREATVLIRVSDPKCFDYEIRQTLEFQIIATESTTRTSSNITITLMILNENDNDPTFTQTSYNGSVVENVKDHFILQVHATDNDAGIFGNISYSLEGDRDRFTINNKTGEITTKDANVDRETKDTYLLTVVATDSGGRRSGVPLAITVTDANDETPVFLYSYASRIAEGSLHFAPNLTLQANDNDQQGSENSHVIYRIANCKPNVCSNFTLDENSGLLAVNSTLDYEKLLGVDGVITITVWAIDNGTLHLTGNTTVQITVEDKNDVQPVFSTQTYTSSVPENAPSGQSVTLVSASDGDGSAPNNVVFYVLESGGSDNFRVNSTSGLITVGQGAKLDREKDANYSLTVLALDRGDPPLSSTATVFILLVDVNDEPPKFNEQTYEISIYENASVGDVNFVVTADDPDTNHDLVYSLLLNESQAFTDRDVSVDSSVFRSWFNISPSTGSMRVTSTLDREKAEMVILKIAVTDRNGSSNLPQTVKTSLRITLRDVNDNKPKITPTGVLNVSEALTIGTEVTTLTAVDLDKDQNVSFFVNNISSPFQITSDGKVFVNRSLDRETSATLEFTVYAKDNGQPSMTSNITIHVNVIDKNDNDPEITNTDLSFNVSEGASNGTVFGVISATDKDEGPNAMITFGFSDIVNDFSINETTGELSVKRNLDRESLDVYKIGIIALDNPTTDVSRRASKQITINILDTNDNSPKFVNFDPNTQSYLGTVAETEPINTSVIKMNPNMIMATDKDVGENARLSYSIHSLGGADYFIINPSDGVITVNASIVGHAGLYNYTLIVTDHGNVPLSVSANLTIKVVDVNLNKPIFRDSAPHILVAECTPKGTSLYTFIADDADQDKESNGKVIYILGNNTMSPADANHFHLNEDTGLLTSAATFDREIQSLFRISVTARDLGVPSPLETILSDVEIALQDENDNPPVFNITRYTFEISESQTSGEVGTVVARDPDNDARTCYSIVSGETVMSSYFNISSNTSNEGVLTLVKTLDREKPEQVTFVFSVTANDCSPSSVACNDIMASKTSSTEVSITVLDVNDNPPNFTQPEYSRGFMTTADFGHVIYNLQELVSDPDTPPNRVHSFYPLGPLEMDQTLKNIESVKNLQEPLILTKNGTVLTNVKFPADAQGLYKWRVMANDSAGNSTTLLKIYIVDEDKLVRITLFQTEDRLRTLQSEIVREISRQTGFEIVADEIKPFIDSNGIVDPSKSNLLIHAVKPDETILDASSLLETMDRLNSLIQTMKNSYQVLSIQTEKVAAAAGDTEGAKIELILAAIIVVLVMAFLITLFLMLNNIRRFKRKLKSATTSAGEMSPIASSPLDRSGIKNNPLYGKEIMNETNVDNTSIASSDSMDKNYVIRPPLENEEQEMKINIYGNEDELPAYKNRQNYLQNVLDGADVENGDPKGFTFNDSELLHTEI